jgi:hypothetical protein
MSDLDLTPEAVEQLHPFRALVRQVDPVQGNGTWDEEFMAVRYDDVEPIVRALSARVEELKAERDARIDPVHVEGMIKSAEPMLVEAYEAELATARADAALIAELVKAGNVMANALRGDYIVPGSAGKWFAALAKMKEGA